MGAPQRMKKGTGSQEVGCRDGNRNRPGYTNARIPLAFVAKLSRQPQHRLGHEDHQQQGGDQDADEQVRIDPVVAAAAIAAHIENARNRAMGIS